MSIRMVAVDLDGTLMRDDKSLSDRTVQTVKRAFENGIQVVFCTGRYMCECRYVLEKLPEVRYAVSCTGARVDDLHADTLLYHFALTADEARLIYDRVKPYESIISCMSANVTWHEAAAAERNRSILSSELWELYQKGHVAVDDLEKMLGFWKEPVEKYYILYPDMETQRLAREAVQDLPFFVSSAAYSDMEIMSPEANKGRSLGLLAAHLGIRPEEVAAIGDSENDAAALQYAGLAVAMGNGAKALKELADVVAPSNEDDGVAWVLEQIMEGKL